MAESLQCGKDRLAAYLSGERALRLRLISTVEG